MPKEGYANSVLVRDLRLPLRLPDEEDWRFRRITTPRFAGEMLGGTLARFCRPTAPECFPPLPPRLSLPCWHPLGKSSTPPKLSKRSTSPLTTHRSSLLLVPNTKTTWSSLVGPTEKSQSKDKGNKSIASRRIRSLISEASNPLFRPIPPLREFLLNPPSPLPTSSLSDLPAKPLAAPNPPRSPDPALRCVVSGSSAISKDMLPTRS